MTKGDNSVYDASSTIELLEKVIHRHDDYKKEMTPILVDIKAKMKKASEVPLTASDRPVTSIEVIRKTSAMKLIEKLDITFTRECIGIHLNGLVGIYHGTDRDGQFAGSLAALCEFGTSRSTVAARKQYDDMREVTDIHINNAKDAIAQFDEDPSGWILREDIHMLSQHLKYEGSDKKRLQNDLEKAWMRAQSAKAALNGIEEMVGKVFLLTDEDLM